MLCAAKHRMAKARWGTAMARRGWVKHCEAKVKRSSEAQSDAKARLGIVMFGKAKV